MNNNLIDWIEDTIWASLRQQVEENDGWSQGGYVDREMDTIDGYFSFGAAARTIAEVLGSQMDTSKVTRFEVIAEAGRLMVNYDVSVALDLQDDGRTLKVFMRRRYEE